MALANALAYFDTTTIMTVVLEYSPQGIMKKENSFQDSESISWACTIKIYGLVIYGKWTNFKVR
jgi:hypothetical protein